MTDPSQHPHDKQAGKQALRLRRFLLASTTYALGILILALCSVVGLLEWAQLMQIGLGFLAVNVFFFVVFRCGWNLRFVDPSLTQPQICVAACLVGLILVLGEHVHFLAVPFYSSIFVFAMLQLQTRQLVIVEAFVLATYGLAIAARLARFGDRLDLRLEVIDAALVVLCSVWYAVAASYISGLRVRLRESRQTIEALATRDAMTDTWNRRHIDALLASELQRKARIGGKVCVGLVDLDHFKSINDRHGHLVGDAVLQQVAGTMKAQLRAVDQLGRFGGEEFLVLLPGASLADAQACAGRLLASVARLSVPAAPQERVTVSIGLAECGDDEIRDALLARVDAALYRAKRDGRNRIAIAAAPEVQASV
jgi:diguanylate cyclase (GGDEF)-like protein